MVNAQNNLHINITEIDEFQIFNFCHDEYDGIVLSEDPTCNDGADWIVTDLYTNEVLLNTNSDEIIIYPEFEHLYLQIRYEDFCDINIRWFYINFHTFHVQTPLFTQDYIWKRSGSSVTIEAPYAEDCSYLWSNGSHQTSITVSQPGTYWVRIYNDCGEVSDTIQVRDNVETALATCDLETNHNLVTWPVSAAQAEYVSQVEVKRNGLTVGTTPYTDGQFIDAIGSDATSRTYTVRGIATDGTNCPIVSQPKETIHMAYLTGMNNTIEMNWNKPTGYNITGFYICEWNPVINDLSVIDYVGPSVTSYTCSESMFDNGYIVIQAVTSGKSESRLLSNRSTEVIVGIGENAAEKGFKVYPNPANSVLFVETLRATSLPQPTEYRILNPMGQTLLQGAIASERQQIDVRDLPRGMYFITVGGMTQKIVVE